MFLVVFLCLHNNLKIYENNLMKYSGSVDNVLMNRGFYFRGDLHRPLNLENIKDVLTLHSWIGYLVLEGVCTLQVFLRNVGVLK